MKSIEHLSSKNQIIDKIKLIKTFKAIWEYDSKTKEYRLLVTGLIKDEFMPSNGLTEADKQWIANLVVTTVKTAINAALKPINDRLDIIEQDIKAIKACPTIQKELETNKKK